MIRTSAPRARGIAQDLRKWRNQLTEATQDQPRVVTVPINSLRPSDSPRLAGQDIEHVRALADSEVALPPIIVNRPTMCVIDGMHRLRAAVLRGQDEIQVRFFDCDGDDAFVLAVEANIAHGLPLSLADRSAAAARIIKSHPRWSDRAIATTTGLSPKTVAAIRRRSAAESPHDECPREGCSTGEIPQLNNGMLNGRVGLDGRVRPRDTAEGRRIASVLMSDRPDAPLREIAAAAGVSLGTAHDVRVKLRRGESPILPKRISGGRRECQEKNEEPVVQPAPEADSDTNGEGRILVLKRLGRDPSLRLADSGRALLRMLNVLAIDSEDWKRLIDHLPAHCMPMVSVAARACADVWREFAEQLEKR